jgi:hypothetical protein
LCNAEETGVFVEEVKIMKRAVVVICIEYYALISILTRKI